MMKPKPDKDMRNEVEKLGGFRPSTHRLTPTPPTHPRAISVVEIVTVRYCVTRPTRSKRSNAIYRRGLA